MAGRVFLRGLEGERYDLRAHRRQRLAAAHVVHQSERAWRDERTVGHEDPSPQSRAKWMVGPGDDPFLTQTVQCHFVAIDPGGSNGGHGHQNEAAFYIPRATATRCTTAGATTGRPATWWSCTTTPGTSTSTRARPSPPWPSWSSPSAPG